MKRFNNATMKCRRELSDKPLHVNIQEIGSVYRETYRIKQRNLLTFKK